MKNLKRQLAGAGPWRFINSAGVVCLLLVSLASEAFARVGGGQSYGGKSDGGDGDAGAILWLVFELFRVLLYLTIEYPLIGIPLDIIVIAGVIYFLWRRSQNRQPAIFSTAAGSSTRDRGSSTPSDGFVRDFCATAKV